MIKTDPDVLTREEAKAMLDVHDGRVHVFNNMAFGLLGGDHELESVLRDIDEAYMLKRTGGTAQRMGHGLAIIPREKCVQSDLLFVATK